MRKAGVPGVTPAYEDGTSAASRRLAVSAANPSDPAATFHPGEFVLTETGVEGSLVYALSARLRDTIAADGAAEAA